MSSYHPGDGMRRCLAVVTLPVALAAVGTTGCSDFKTLFSAHPGVVAEVGGKPLTAERVSQILTTGGGAEPSREAADYLTQVWVDHALFAQAAVDGKLPLDSASTVEALWSEIAERMARRWQDTLAARSSDATPAQIDSVYQAGDVRVLQHILFRAAPTEGPAAQAAARKKTESTLAQLRGGANFGAMAAKLSEDPGSKVDSGYLPPATRGTYVPTFDSTGWVLEPGAMSGVVESPYGYHIIRRPPVEMVRARLLAYVNKDGARRRDSLYSDSLATANKVEVTPGAAAAIRSAVADPHGSRRSDKALTTFKGGKFTVGEFVRWLDALPPQYTSQLKQMPDSIVQRFAKLLTQNVLFLRAAKEAGMALTPTEWAELSGRHVAQMDTLRREMGLDDPEVADSTLNAAERRKQAMLKLDAYFDELVQGRRRMRPIPPAFAGMLRDKGSYKVYAAGVNRALELAKAKADSASDHMAGPLKRAPGPPPIPAGAGSAPTASPNAAESHETGSHGEE